MLVQFRSTALNLPLLMAGRHLASISSASQIVGMRLIVPSPILNHQITAASARRQKGAA